MFEEYYSEEKTKKYLKIGVIFIFASILIFALVKIFILKPSSTSLPPVKETPALSPEETVIKYFELEQKRNREESEKYLLSDLSKVKILSDDYQNLNSALWYQPEKRGGPLPEYQIKNSHIKKNKANVTLAVTTNKMKDSLFFNFYLPETVVFEIVLVKERGRWKIIEINSPDLVLESKLGEERKIRENIFVKLIRTGNYLPKVINIKQNKGSKLFFLEVEYKNKSNKLVRLSPFLEWQVINKNEEVYYPALKLIRNPKTGDAEYPIIKLAPGRLRESTIMFEVPKNFVAKEAIFQNLYKKIIFKVE